jgi:hypothetical protein
MRDPMTGFARAAGITNTEYAMLVYPLPSRRERGSGDVCGCSAYDRAPAVPEMSWCGGHHDQDVDGRCVDVLRRHNGGRRG